MSDERYRDNQNADAVERLLKSYSPTLPQIDRDRLMFLAGQASALASGGPGTAAQQWSVPGQLDAPQSFATAKLTLPARRASHGLWPASTAAFAATSLALAIALVVRPLPQPQVAYVERPAPVELTQGNVETSRDAASPRVSAAGPEAAATVPADNYVRTREVALRMGLDAIGAPSASSTGQRAAPTYGSFLHERDPAPTNLPGAMPWLESLFNL